MTAFSSLDTKGVRMTALLKHLELVLSCSIPVVSRETTKADLKYGSVTGRDALLLVELIPLAVGAINAEFGKIYIHVSREILEN